MVDRNPVAVAEKVYVEIQYPESDGQPMAESEVHIDALIYLLEALRYHFRLRPDVYVIGNMFLYYEEGNPEARVAPDVMVVFGVPKRPPRRVYKLWEEGKPPTVVFEITSRSTRSEDLYTKRGLYEDLGVKEYYLFDPLGEYLDPRLRVYKRVGEVLMPAMVRPAGKGEWEVDSETLGVKLRTEGSLLRVVDLSTGEAIEAPGEALERAQREAEARRLAEERIKALEEELARLRARLSP